MYSSTKVAMHLRIKKRINDLKKIVENMEITNEKYKGLKSTRDFYCNKLTKEIRMAENVIKSIKMINDSDLALDKRIKRK